jgi:hypothetical protein
MSTWKDHARGCVLPLVSAILVFPMMLLLPSNGWGPASWPPIVRIGLAFVMAGLITLLTPPGKGRRSLGGFCFGFVVLGTAVNYGEKIGLPLLWQRLLVGGVPAVVLLYWSNPPADEQIVNRWISGAPGCLVIVGTGVLRMYMIGILLLPDAWHFTPEWPSVLRIGLAVLVAWLDTLLMPRGEARRRRRWFWASVVTFWIVLGYGERIGLRPWWLRLVVGFALFYPMSFKYETPRYIKRLVGWWKARREGV